MPIIDVVGIGQVELPDGMSREQMAAALNKLPKPKFQPTEQNRGNIINTDVPTVVGSQPNAVNLQPPSKPVSMMDRVKAVYEVPTAIVSGAAAPFLGVGAGIAENIMQGTNKRVDSPEFAQRFQYQPTSPVSQDILQTMGSALETAKIPPFLGSIGAIPSFVQKAPNVAPVVQESVIPAANRMAGALRNEGQMIQEAVQPVTSRVAQAVEPVTVRMAEALRKEPRIDIAGIGKTAPSAEDLAQTSKDLFKTAKDAGVQIDSKDFAVNMKQIGKDLENIGYDAELHPDIAIVLNRLTDPNIPKDFNKIKALRTMIGDLQGGDTKLKRSVATQLKSDFDSYLSTIPESSVTSGSKEGLKAWKDARDSYAKLSKSEIFTDMLEIAELEKTQFSASGAENSLSKQLRQLAKNDKKMRLFTKEEQAAIKQAAKGSTTQNVLRLFGKFAPTSSVNTILPLLATAVSGPVGLGLTAGAMGARYGATKMRKSDVNQLAAMMRAGAKKEEK
jgi:hypothetical protein